MTSPVFSLHAVATLFLERQHLTRPLGLRLGAKTLGRFVSDAGGLQIDSINVLERAHHLTLWSRFGAYDRAGLDRLIFGRRVLFEYWAHGACFVPVADLAAWRRAMLDYVTAHTGWAKWLRKNTRLLEAIEAQIRERGPLSNADFKAPRPAGKGGWWSWRPSTHALHCLWMSGRTLVDSRRHFQKRFDLAPRVLPAIEFVEPLSTPQFAQWHVTRTLHALGAATETDLRMYLTFPRIAVAARKRVLDRLLRAGDVVEIAIEGDRTRWLALARDLPGLERAARRRAGNAPSRGTAMLAPFDSFLWHRERIRRLFDFNYTIEVYVPGHKRVHGYYSLPILHDGRLIGRLDAKTHPAERRLEVKHVHFEPWLIAGAAAPLAHFGAVDLDEALAGVAHALRSLALFVGAERVALSRVSPSKVRAPLARALRAAPPVRTVEQTSRRTFEGK